MSDHVYKTIEVTGSSSSGTDAAIQSAVSRAAKTIHDLRWFQVTEIRGDIDAGGVAHWQVTMKIGFTLDDASATS